MAFDDLTTSGVLKTDFNYSPTLPALPPNLDAAFTARRRAITRGVEQTVDTANVEAKQTRAQAQYDLSELGRNIDRSRRAGMGQLAARGLARQSGSRTAFERGLLASEERETFSIQQRMGDRLRQLKRMVSEAIVGAEPQYAQLDFERLMERSAIDRLLGEI